MEVKLAEPQPKQTKYSKTCCSLSSSWLNGMLPLHCANIGNLLAQIHPSFYMPWGLWASHPYIALPAAQHSINGLVQSQLSSQSITSNQHPWQIHPIATINISTWTAAAAALAAIGYQVPTSWNYLGFPLMSAHAQPSSSGIPSPLSLNYLSNNDELLNSPRHTNVIDGFDTDLSSNQSNTLISDTGDIIKPYPIACWSNQFANGDAMLTSPYPQNQSQIDCNEVQFLI